MSDQQSKTQEAAAIRSDVLLSANKHTFKDAKYALHAIKTFWSLNPNYKVDAVLIGSFAEGKESDHDIDILLPAWMKKTNRLKFHLKCVLNAGKVEDTDWGGWFFHDTEFGDVDIFFTKEVVPEDFTRNTPAPLARSRSESWFAWRPVKLTNGKWAWLRRVSRFCPEWAKGICFTTYVYNEI